MFKKTLLALTLAGAAVGAANAATVAVGGGTVNVSLEGNLSATGGASALVAADAGAVTITTGTAYIVNDLLVITVSGAKFNTAVTPTVTPAAGTTTYTFVDFSDDNTVRFRVSTADEAAARVLTFAGWALKTTGAADKGKISFASKAISTNSLIGEYDAGKAADVFAFRSQFAQTVTKLDGEVSTGKGRAEFTGGSPNQDSLGLVFTDHSGDVDAIAFTKVVHTVKGNFSWVADYDLVANGGDGDGTMDAAELATAFTTTGVVAAGGADSIVYTLDAGYTTLTATNTLTGGVDNYSISLNNVGNAAGGSAIAAPQSFTIDTVATGATGSATLAQASAGSFTLDGSTTDIEFLPFGPQYKQAINVVNKGSVDGAITVDLIFGGKTYSKTLTATAAPMSTTSIAGEVAAFAAENNIEGNARVVVTVNAPSVVTKGLFYHAADKDRVLTK